MELIKRRLFYCQRIKLIERMRFSSTDYSLIELLSKVFMSSPPAGGSVELIKRKFELAILGISKLAHHHCPTKSKRVTFNLNDKDMFSHK